MIEKPLHNTAILLFSRTASQEAVEKRFMSGRHAGLQNSIYEDLLLRASQVASRTELPFFHVDETIQKGSNFSERIESAFQYVFKLGFSNVIAIGNDCPDLNKDIIHEAALELEHHDVVLGPAADGGSYLIGLNKKAFDNMELASLPWQTRQFHSSFLYESAESQLKTTELELLLSDIDNASDFYKIYRSRPELFVNYILACETLLNDSVLLPKYLLENPSSFSKSENTRAPPEIPS